MATETDERCIEINLLTRRWNCTKVCVSNKCVCSQDELSNDIETLLEEIRDVQMRLTELPDESLDTMETGLKVRLAVYMP